MQRLQPYPDPSRTPTASVFAWVRIGVETPVRLCLVSLESANIKTGLRAI